MQMKLFFIYFLVHILYSKVKVSLGNIVSYLMKVLLERTVVKQEKIIMRNNIPNNNAQTPRQSMPTREHSPTRESPPIHTRVVPNEGAVRKNGF